jgi:hypothetical protein
MTDVIDSTAVELAPEGVGHDDHQAPATTVVRRERRSEVIRPLDTEQLVDSFKAYQDLLPRLLDASDYQSAEDGKKFVTKSGWRKIATAFDLDVVLVREVAIDRDPDGNPLRARAWARAIAPSGRSMDGDGYCSADEPRFKRSGGRRKIENDLAATATTRAKNRAIADLVGMGAVSAEEVGAGSVDAGPQYGPEADENTAKQAGPALTQLLGDAQAAKAAWGDVKRACGGYMPQAVAMAIRVLANPTHDQDFRPAGHGS